MTKDELLSMIGEDTEISRVMDVKTLVMDLIRQNKLEEEEILTVFWRHLDDLEEEFVTGYFYRKYSK